MTSLLSMQLDEYGQKTKLMNCLQLLNEYKHYSCLEKHKSGILHSHTSIS